MYDRFNYQDKRIYQRGVRDDQGALVELAPCDALGVPVHSVRRVVFVYERIKKVVPG